MRRRALRPRRVSPFKRALILGPFQIPITAYLVYIGVLYFLLAPAVADELGIEVWPLYNLAGLLFTGSVISLLGRFREKERWEAWGLAILLIAMVEATVIEVTLHMWLQLGDNLSVGAGCLLRLWVIAKARKVERIANNMVMSNDDPEGR